VYLGHNSCPKARRVYEIAPRKPSQPGTLANYALSDRGPPTVDREKWLVDGRKGRLTANGPAKPD